MNHEFLRTNQIMEKANCKIELANSVLRIKEDEKLICIQSQEEFEADMIGSQSQNVEVFEVDIDIHIPDVYEDSEEDAAAKVLGGEEKVDEAMNCDDEVK